MSQDENVPDVPVEPGLPAGVLPMLNAPYPASPSERDEPEVKRKIPEILLEEVVSWALNRERPEDPIEQEEVFAVLFWYLPEDLMYREARERWGMGVHDIQKIVSRPTFYDALGQGARVLMIKTYTRVILAMSDRAERGNLPAANFLFEEMGMKREHLVGQQHSDNLERLVGKLIIAVEDVLPQNQKAALGIVRTPGFVPQAVLPPSFHTLPEPMRRRVITKSGTYGKRTGKRTRS